MDENKPRRGVFLSVWSIILLIFISGIILILTAGVFFLIGRETVSGGLAQGLNQYIPFKSITAPQTPSQPLVPQAPQVPQSPTAPQIAHEPTIVDLSQKGSASKSISDSPQNIQDPAVKASVANYFVAMDKVMKGTRKWDDPEAFATNLVKSLLINEDHSFQNFVNEYTNSISAIEAINAPKDCQKHKEKSLAVMNRGLKVLNTIKLAVKKGDASELISLPGEAAKLKADAESCDEEAKIIKRIYGIEDKEKE